jgi:hypothetical protein
MFKEVSLPHIGSVKIPDDIFLEVPASSSLAPEMLHYLVYIPWNEAYLSSIPAAYLSFFKEVLPQLNTRTTDVHVAICFGYFAELLAAIEARINKSMNQRVVALALLFHDIGWSQLSEFEIANSLGVTGLALNENAMGPKEKHAVVGEKTARDILPSWVNKFSPPLTTEEIKLICQAVRWHDKPEMVAGDGTMPIEVGALVDLDHMWSFTHHNFWQDTIRKKVSPPEYLQNLEKDLQGYFVTPEGRNMAKKLLAERTQEVTAWTKK